jgi:predicted nucleic acid-binding protein
VTTYCFDTDVLSAVVRREPLLHVVRRVAAVPPADQVTTSITVGELLYGAHRVGSAALASRIRSVLEGAITIAPFDTRAAERYAELRARLEADGRPLAEPDLRIASIALAGGHTLVTGNVRHFERIEGLPVENWLEHSG